MKRQFYSLYQRDYDDCDPVGVYEGPVGLNISELRTAFDKLLRPASYPRYPVYNGPRMKVEPLRGGSVCSGPFSMTDDDGTVADVASKEYKEWNEKCIRISARYADENDKAFKAMKKLYPGRDEVSMFISWLKREHGFKEVKATAFSI